MSGKSLIPQRFGFGGGRVVGTSGNMSREADVVFYDKLNCPQFISAASSLFPSLGVHGIAEIKSTLDKTELIDSLNKIASFKKLYDTEPGYFEVGTRRLTRAGSEPVPFGIVFAFKNATSLTTLADNLKEFDLTVAERHRANLIVVPTEGIIARSIDGERPTCVWDQFESSFPRYVVTVESKYKTLRMFYQMLTELLVSVPTFPISPTLYLTSSTEILGHTVIGQWREINASTLKLERLTEAFLKAVVQFVTSTSPTTFQELDRIAFVDRSIDFVPMAESGEVWLYDPDAVFKTLTFPPFTVVGTKEPIVSLLSACAVLQVDTNVVLIPRSYYNAETVETENLGT